MRLTYPHEGTICGLLKSRRGVLAACLLAAYVTATLCHDGSGVGVAVGQTSSAEQDAKISFVFYLDRIGDLMGSRNLFRVEVKSKYKQPGRQQTFNLTLGIFEPDDPHVLGKSTPSLASNAPNDEAKNGNLELKGSLEELKGARIPFKLGNRRFSPEGFLTLDDINWPGYESASYSYVHADEGRVLIVKDLPLAPSTYNVKASAETPPLDIFTLVDTKKELEAGETITVRVRQPGIFETLKEQYVTANSLLITVILALAALLLGVLKERIKDGINWLLDVLGKYGTGRLAERRFLRRYLSAVTFNHKYLKLIGLSSHDISRPLLEEVFVSLRIANQFGAGGNIAAEDGADAGGRVVPFQAAFRQYQKMVVLGGPGAGKTTTLSYALLAFAQNKGAERFGIQRRYLPLYIPLRRLSGIARSVVDDVLDPETQILSPELLKEVPKNYFEKKLKRGECLVLLDGLDEVVDEVAHRRVATKIDDLVAAYPGNRYVVTCRLAGWRSLLSGEFMVLQAQNFNRDEIQRFVHGWHRAVITQRAHSRLQREYRDEKKFDPAWQKYNEEKVKPAIEVQTRNLMRSIDSSNRIMAIAINPMLLSLICLVHYVRGLLPKGRTLLYSQCIDLLIDTWDRTRDIAWNSAGGISPQQKEAVLREIAFEYQRRGVGEESRESLEKIISEVTAKLGIGAGPKELLEEIEQRSGLLIERSIDVFGFSHLTLQEYLVAKHVQLKPEHRESLLGNVGRQEWREVILLYAGLLDDATELVRRIIGDDVGERWILAGHCIGDAQHCDPALARMVVGRLFSMLKEGLDREQVVESLSSVAEDFDDSTKSVGQRLSQVLIVELKTYSLDDKAETFLLDCISILAKAKITKALPELVSILLKGESPLCDGAARALVTFGNLAVPEIEARLSGVVASAVNRAPRFAEPPTVLLGVEIGRPQPEGESPIAPVVGVLRDINTAASAKTLANLYGLAPRKDSNLITLALGQMLANPFVETDLRQQEHILAGSVHPHLNPDGDSWPMEMPASGDFEQLERRIRRDVQRMLSRPARSERGEESPGEVAALLRPISFKLLYPAIINHIREGFPGANPPIDLSQDKGEHGEFLTRYFSLFNFQGTKPDTLLFLCRQIQANQALNLTAALQNAGTTDRDLTDRKQSRIKYAWLILTKALLIIISLWHLLIGGTGTLMVVLSLVSDSDFLDRDLILYWLFLGPLLLHVVMVTVTLLKYQKKRLSWQTLTTLLVPLPRFLNVLPYFTRYKSKLKTAVFLLSFTICSYTGFASLVLFYSFLFGRRPNQLAWTLLIILGLHALSLVACISYVKYVLRTQNPIYQLLLLHPDGRKAVGEYE